LPRCVKDLIEQRLFDRRRDLFTDLRPIFDTLSGLAWDKWLILFV
jgi:hypothetical protein